MFKLPGLFSKLPDDISNEIFIIYWQSEYHNVIIEMNNIINNCNYLVNSMTKFNDIEYTNQKFKKSITNNQMIKKIISNKGTKLLSKVIDKTFNFISKNNNVFNNNKIGLIYQYKCIKSKNMRFYVHEEYKNMIKNIN